MANVKIDFSKNIGKIKPMHGVNSGPRTKVFTYNASDIFEEIGVPTCRLHDVEYPYGSGEFVDVHCIFKNFDADENDPASYDFGLTDHYIKACLDVGADVRYRLGESIEHAPVKRYIHPPKDFSKWARICEHIIRHYNEGWADGYNWNITYWEIWNEPDLDANREIKKTWSGTVEQFYDFYETAAKHLKACFPRLKIGGPAIAGNAAWADSFLKAMSERDVPLDFFSWHKYSSDISAYVKHDVTMHDLLVKYGYADAEIFLDEWNYMENWGNQPPSFKKLVGMTGAAFCSAALTTFQHSHLSGAEYFEADVVKEWCGLFEVEDMSIDSLAHKDSKGKLKPRKPYYAFRYFGDLYRLEVEALSESDSDSVYVLAATDGKAQKAVVSTYRSVDGECKITLNGLGAYPTVKIYLTDKNNTDALVGSYDLVSDCAVFSLDLADEQIYRIEVEYNN